MSTQSLKFSEIIQKLNKNYPLILGEKWDNVGLLVEPSNCNDKVIKKIFLTIDLTEPVLEEAIKKQSDFIISYHPPLFAPFKQVTQKTVSQRIAIKAIENRIPIYSPHSILDSIKDGMNDWMANGLLEMSSGKGSRRPLQPIKQSSLFNDNQTHKLTVYLQDKSESAIKELSNSLSPLQRIINDNNQCGGIFEYASNISELSNYIDYLKGSKNYFDIQLLLDKIPSQLEGPGRLVTLDHEVSIDQVIKRVKELFNIDYIRLAKPLGEAFKEKKIKTISICPGSGGMMIFQEKADLYLTGELKHHEVLDACAKGSYVIVCDHSNTERGFLTHYKSSLLDLFSNKVEIEISELDKDPLTIV